MITPNLTTLRKYLGCGTQKRRNRNRNFFNETLKNFVYFVSQKCQFWHICTFGYPMRVQTDYQFLLILLLNLEVGLFFFSKFLKLYLYKMLTLIIVSLKNHIRRNYIDCLFWLFQTICEAMSNVELIAVLSQPPKCWQYRHILPCPAIVILKFMCSGKNRND